VNDVIPVPSPSDQHPVNYDAGADLLHKYQTEWNQLHLLAEDNAHKAEVSYIYYYFSFLIYLNIHIELQEVNEMINLLHHQMSKQLKKMDTITSCMDSMPQLVKSIESTMDDIGNFTL